MLLTFTYKRMQIDKIFSSNRVCVLLSSFFSFFCANVAQCSCCHLLSSPRSSLRARARASIRIILNYIMQCKLCGCGVCGQARAPLCALSRSPIRTSLTGSRVNWLSHSHCVKRQQTDKLRDRFNVCQTTSASTKIDAGIASES